MAGIHFWVMMLAAVSARLIIVQKLFVQKLLDMSMCVAV